MTDEDEVVGICGECFTVHSAALMEKWDGQPPCRMCGGGGTVVTYRSRLQQTLRSMKERRG